MYTRPRVQRAPGFPCALRFKWRTEVAQSSRALCRENTDAYPLAGPTAAISVILRAFRHKPCACRKPKLKAAGPTFLGLQDLGVAGPRHAEFGRFRRR